MSGVAGQYLADQEHLVAAPADRFADDLLGTTVSIHLRGVDQRQAEVEPHSQRADLVVAT